MPAKGEGRGELHLTEEFPGATGWVAHPTETMRRAGHALFADGNVWLVDPVDAAGLDDYLTQRGTVQGVVVLFNHHRRDAAAIARRHDVPVYLPAGMTALDDGDVAAPVERFDGRLPGTSLELDRVVHGRLWQEYRLYDGETLYVPESVGTAPYHLAPGEELGVSWLRRLRPPRAALRVDPERLLLGHGAGFEADAAARLREALDGARRRFPSLLAANATTLPRVFAAAVR